MDYNLNSGSGSGDMFAYIADSLFTGGTFVTLYSKFMPNNDGYDEWAVRSTEALPPVVPEPASMLIWTLGLALCGGGSLRFRLRRKG